MTNTHGMTPKIFEFNNENDFVIKASSAIENFIEKNKSKNIRIALSGGSSPKKVYETLAKSQKIDWIFSECLFFKKEAL